MTVSMTGKIEHVEVITSVQRGGQPQPRNSGMTHSGRSPRATRWMLSKELRNAFFQFSQLGPAMCGVRTIGVRTILFRIVQAEELVLGGRRLFDHDIEPGPADAIG